MKIQIKNAENYLYEYDQILWEMSNKMFSKKATNNITYNFIKCIIPHQKAAIYMCENLLQYTDSYPLGQLSYNIINNQKEMIKQIKVIMKNNSFYNLPNEVNNYISDYLNITREMVYEMINSMRTINININFISEMIPHHYGLIEMCKNVLKYNIDPRLNHLANNMIKTANEEIRQLEMIYNNMQNKI